MAGNPSICQASFNEKPVCQCAAGYSSLDVSIQGCLLLKATFLRRETNLMVLGHLLRALVLPGQHAIGGQRIYANGLGLPKHF